MRQNQKGFSLVELIVVIAVMAVLTTGGLLTYGLVTGQNLKSCASEVESYLGQSRVQALSRESAYLTLSVTNEGVLANLSVEGRDVKIGKPGITVSYKTSGGSTVTLGGTENLVLSFDRSSGAFKPLASGEGSEIYCTEILLQSKNRAVRITLIPQTGKYYAEYEM